MSRMNNTNQFYIKENVRKYDKCIKNWIFM